MINLESGRCFPDDSGSIDISESLVVTDSKRLLLYSDGVPGIKTGSFLYTCLSREEKEELAELMIDRWKKFGEITDTEYSPEKSGWQPLSKDSMIGDQDILIAKSVWMKLPAGKMS